jgi:hypothetical protein
MSARDELRGTLCNTVCNASNYAKRAQPHLLGSDMSIVLDKTADAILVAGYRKPRTITTAEELDAAIAAAFEYAGHVVVSDSRGRPWIIWGDEDGDEWIDSWPQEDDPERLTLSGIKLPATVLHEGATK